MDKKPNSAYRQGREKTGSANPLTREVTGRGVGKNSLAIDGSGLLIENRTSNDHAVL